MLFDYRHLNSVSRSCHWVFISCLILLSFTAQAGPGLDWLVAQQQADGQYATTTDLATPYQATAETLRTLHALGEQTQPGVPAAYQFLENESYQGTEYLARRIIADLQHGVSVTDRVATLLSYQNQDGGFGEFPGYQSTPLDTAFALDALAAAGQTSNPSLGLAVSYLQNQQQADGGWANGENASHVYPTALVLDALSRYQSTYNLTTAITTAQNDVLDQSSSQVWPETHQSALALIALINTLDDLSPIAGHLSALRARQRADGSWDGDVYTTALALRALKLAEAPPTNPGLATIIGTVIDGQSGLPLNNITLDVTGPTSKTTQTVTDGSFRFTDLIGGNYTLSISASGYAPISAETRVNAGQTINFGTIQLVNEGTATVGIIRGVVTDAATGLPLPDVFVSIQGGDSMLTDAMGAYAFAQITPGPAVLTATLNGYSTATGTTDVVAGGLFIFSPQLTAVSEPITAIQGRVTDGNSGVPLAGVTITVSGSTLATSTTDVDGSFQISDLNPGDITAVASLSGYDSVITTATVFENNVLVFSPGLYPANTTPGDQNTTGVTGLVVDTVSNQPLANVTVDAFFGETPTTTTTDASGRFTLTNLTETEGNLIFSLTDYDSGVATLSLQPLTILDIGTVTLKQSAVQELKPDLVVTTVDNTTTNNDPDTLELSGVLTVEIGNTGTATAPGGVEVIAFYDNDRNQQFDIQIDTLLGDAQTAVDIPVDGSETLTIPVQGTLPYRDALIHVWVDSAQEVIELGETNNIATSAAQCGSEPATTGTAPEGFTVADGYSLEVYATKVTGQQGPTQLAIDSQDNLYFSPGSSGAGIKIPVETGITELFGDTGTSDPDGVAIDSQDNVIIAGSPVLKFTPDGTLIWSRSCPGGNISLADVDENDMIYVGSLSSVLCKFSPDGELEILSPLPTPHAPGFAPDGTLYVVQLFSPNIYTANPDTGEFLDVVLPSFHANQLAFDRNSNIYAGYLNDPSGSATVVKIDPITRQIQTLVNGINSPTGFVFDSNDDLFISDATTKTIYKLTTPKSTGVDLTISQLSFNNTSVTALIGNGGQTDSPDGVIARLYEGDPAAGGVAVSSLTLEAIPADSAQLVSFTGFSLTGGQDLYVVVDATGQVVECREDNNTAQLAAPDLKPDLLIDSIDTTGVSTDLFSLDVTGGLAVAVSNQGIATAQAPLDVLAYYDVNANGVFDSATDQTLGQQTLTNDILVGNSTQVTIPMQGTLPFRDAPIQVWVDASEQVNEFKENNNHTSTATSCRIATTSIEEFDFIEKWYWSGSVFGPVNVAQLSDDNNDGEINQDDIPDILFANRTGSGGRGNLTALSGETGQVLWKNTSITVTGYGSPAIADIDGDGLVEIIIPNSNRLKLYAFEHDGTLKWTTATGPSFTFPRDAVALADIDHDGDVEIVHGRRTFDHLGNLLWEGSGDSGGDLNYGTLPIIVDLDQQGDMEVIAGRTAYRSDGSILWRRTDLPANGGFTAVGNFNQDDDPEITLVAGGRVYLLDNQGQTIWGPISIPGGGSGGAPTIGDFDGDGEPEIGIAGGRNYVVLETDGTIKWTSPTQDRSSSRTGSSLFDFNLDGKVEVVYADELYLRVYEGATGTIIKQHRLGSGTTLEYPVIADIDADGKAEIVMGSNHFSSQNGLFVFEDVHDNWAPTRSIWNQHSYHITNINDDGTVPQFEQPSWLTHNTYRLNTFADRDPSLLADLTAAALTLEETGLNQASLHVRIGNAGAGDVTSAISVAFYEGDPSAGGQLLGAVSIPSLAQGAYQDVTLDNIPAVSGDQDLHVVVDSDQTVTECDETNNSMVLPVASIQAGGQISVATDQLAYGPEQPVQLKTTITNTSVLPGAYHVILRIEDDQGSVVDQFDLGTTEVIASGATVTLTQPWSTAQYLVGPYQLKGLLYTTTGDPAHQAQSGFAIQHATNGDPLAALRTTTDQAAYATNATVQLNNLAQNLTSNQIIENATLEVTISDPTGTVIYSDTQTITSLVSGANRDLLGNFALIQAAEGLYTVNGTLLDSANQTLATDTTQFTVRADLQQLLTGTVTAQLASLDRGQPQTCTDTITHTGTNDLTALPVRQVVVNLTDGLAMTTTELAIDLVSGSTQTLSHDIVTQSFDAGDHACILQAQVDGEWVTLANDTFIVTVPPIEIVGQLTPGDRGRVLILLDDAPKRCDGFTQLGVETTLASPLTTTTTVTTSLYDDLGTLIDQETGLVNDRLLDQSTGIGVNLIVDDIAPTHLAASLQAETTLGDAYQITIITDDGTATDTLDSGLIATDCSADLNPGHLYGDLHLTDVVRLPAANDPLGPNHTPDLATQRSALEAVLNAAGWSYTIVTTADDFTHEFRTGGYVSYLLLSEQVKLDEAVQKELRDAIYRGEGLIEAGSHDQRQGRIDDALGVKFQGKHPHMTGISIADNAMTASGAVDFQLTDRTLNASLDGATAIATYTGSTDPAVTVYDYGQGQSVYLGFDLAAELALAHTTTVETILLDALNHVHPDSLTAFEHSVYPIRITLDNLGIATPGQVSLTVPAEVTLIDAGTAAVDGQTLTWPFDLAEPDQQILDAWIRLPATAVTLNGLIQSGIAPDWVEQGTFTLTITPDAMMTVEAVHASAAVLTGKDYKQVNKYLGWALDDIQAGRWADALSALLRASDALVKLDTPQSEALRLDVANAMRGIAIHVD